jgi:hypothetical protein
MFQVSPVPAHRVSVNGADVVVSSYPRTGEAFEHDAESSGRNVEVAGLEPDTVRVRDPQPVVFQVNVGDEMVAASVVVVEAISETGKGGDWHGFPSSKCGAGDAAKFVCLRRQLEIYTQVIWGLAKQVTVND